MDMAGVRVGSVSDAERNRERGEVMCLCRERREKGVHKRVQVRLACLQSGFHNS